MKRSAWQLSISVSAALAMAALPGQAREGGLRVRIPFQFAVAEKTLPAGEYQVTSVGDRALLVQNTRFGKGGLMVPTEQVRGHVFDGPGDLIFNRYGDQCFLSQAWTFGSDIGRQLPKSGQEKRIADSTRYRLVVLKRKPGF